MNSIPDPEQPEGHWCMSQTERLQTLDSLKKMEKELLNRMACLPVRMDTAWIRAQKGELDRKLKEVEDATRVFSRKKVFVKMNE